MQRPWGECTPGMSKDTREGHVAGGGECIVGGEIWQTPDQAADLWVTSRTLAFSLSEMESHWRALIRQVTPFNSYLVPSCILTVIVKQN